MTQSWELSYYLIGYLDILGQKDQLLRLNRLPTTQKEQEEAALTLESTASYVMSLRNCFREYFEASSKPTGLLDDLPRDERALAEQMRSCEVELRGVSDSIIITVPLANTNEHCTPITGVYSALFGICGIFSIALASEKPFRGGVDIGLGTRIGDQEVYGSALVRAACLESSVAKYPRVVVGDALWDYICSIETEQAETPFGKRAKKVASDCKGFICTDHDGRRVLDVIGEGVRSVNGGVPPDFVSNGYSFVVKTQERLQELGNQELFQRYTHLRNYLESRLRLWG